jgi:hypothetical protein
VHNANTLAGVRIATGAARPAWWGLRLAGRLVLIAAAAGYLAFMELSHSMPVSPTLQVALAGGGWLIFVSQMIIAFVTRPPRLRRMELYGRPRPRVSWRMLRGQRDLAVVGALFAVLMVAAVAAGATGNVSNDCTSSATCIKIDNWRVTEGNYYRQYPYDVAGNDDPSAPWVRISRAEYVAEVGTLLRSAAFFGLFALTLGMLVNLSSELLVPDPISEL